MKWINKKLFAAIAAIMFYIMSLFPTEKKKSVKHKKTATEVLKEELDKTNSFDNF